MATNNILKKKIEAFRFYNSLLIDDLDKLISDQYKLINGYNIIFAIDFSLLHKFIFKNSFMDSLFTKSKSRESFDSIWFNNSKEILDRKKEYIKLQFVLSFLFGVNITNEFKRTIKSPILLPTYLSEMINHFACKDIQSTNMSQKLTLYKKYGINVIENESDKIILNKVYNFYKDKGIDAILPVSDLNKIIDILKKNRMYDLLFWLANLHDGSEKDILKLTQGKNKSLRLDPEELLNYKGKIEETIKDSNTLWLDAFNTIRPSRVAANLIDSKSIEIVDNLNNEFETRKEKLYICVLSNAASMEVVANFPLYPEEMRKIMATGQFTENEISRLNCFNHHRRLTALFIFMNAVEINGKDKNKIIKYLELKRKEAEGIRDDIVKKAELITMRCYGNCNSCYDNNDCSIIKNQIKKFFRFKKELEEWSIIAMRKIYMTQNASDINRLNSIDNSAWTLLNFLMGEHSELDQRIELYRKNGERNISKVISNLRKSIKECFIDTLNNIKFSTNLIRRMPFDVQFHDKEIRNIYAGWCSLVEKSPNILELAPYFRKMYYYAYSEANPSSEDVYLLRVLVCYLLGTLEDVIQLVNSIFDKTSNQFNLYCMLVLAKHQIVIQNRSLTGMEEVKTVCKEITSKWSKEPIVFYLQAVFYARIFITRMDIIGSKQIALNSYDEAISLCKGKKYSAFFKALLFNGKAYLLADDDVDGSNNDNIDKAVLCINKMEKLANINGWVARFWDTKGFVYFKLASKNKNEFTQQYYQISYESHKKALEMAVHEKYQNWEIKCMSANLETVRNILFPNP